VEKKKNFFPFLTPAQERQGGENLTFENPVYKFPPAEYKALGVKKK